MRALQGLTNCLHSSLAYIHECTLGAMKFQKQYVDIQTGKEFFSASEFNHRKSIM